jgi:hypothetical protein
MSFNHHELAPLVDTFEDAGGLFAMLLFVHFVADFVHQSATHKDAKYVRHWQLLKHSFIYAVQFWLFCSHVIIDSGYFTRIWILKLYRPPDLFDGLATRNAQYDDAGFSRAIVYKWAMTPNGRIMTMMVDQIQHATALWPLVIMTLY